jgi:ERCC4-type nuclease
MIDFRESQLIKTLSTLGVIHTVCRLTEGDIQVQDSHGGVLCIIERKTLSDFVASIKDGRYKQQKTQVLLNKPTHVKYILLLEGYHGFYLSQANVVSCLLTMVFRDGIYLIQTKSLADTAAFLTSILTRCTAQGSTFFHATQVDYLRKVQQTFVARQKKAAVVNVKQCFLAQLCTIPGISHVKATNLIEHLQVDNMLAFCELCKKKGGPELRKVRGIGESLSNNILRCLGL